MTCDVRLICAPGSLGLFYELIFSLSFLVSFQKVLAELASTVAAAVFTPLAFATCFELRLPTPLESIWLFKMDPLG